MELNFVVRCEKDAKIAIATLESYVKCIKEEEKEGASLNDFGFSTRTLNCLKSYGIYTLENLIEKTQHQIIRIPNIGRRSLLEIESKLHELGLSLKQPS